MSEYDARMLRELLAATKRLERLETQETLGGGPGHDHDPVTLGPGSDPALTLIGQQLTLDLDGRFWEIGGQAEGAALQGGTTDGQDVEILAGGATALYIDQASSRVGIFDSTPSYTLDVAGQIGISPAAANPPFVLGANAQGQLVAGLNADLLDGNHAAAFSLVGHTHDHGTLGGLGDDDHPIYLLADGTRELTGDWDIGDGMTIYADAVVARDGDGLALYDSGGLGIFVDAGNVQVGPNAYSQALLTIYDATVDTTNNYYGLYNRHVKTAGATDVDDLMAALRSELVLNQSGGVFGHTYGNLLMTQLVAGGVGDGSNQKSLYGAYVRAMQSGGTIYGKVYGAQSICNLDAGTVNVSAYGLYTTVDQGAGHTIGSNAFGIYIDVDLDGTVGSSSYMLYLKESTGIDYGIYQDGTATNVLGGSLGIGTAAPAYQLEVAGQIGCSPAGAAPPFVLNANAQGRLVVGLNADEVDGYHGSEFGALAEAETVTGGWTFDDSITFYEGVNDEATVGYQAARFFVIEMVEQTGQNADIAIEATADTGSSASVWIQAEEETGSGDDALVKVYAGTGGIYVQVEPVLYVNDISNAKMTQGVTIQQGANDDEILSLKSSDVAHGMTTRTETDTFMHIQKNQADYGGATIAALKEAGGSIAGTALRLSGLSGDSPADTTKTTAGRGVVEIWAQEKSGTSSGACSTDVNLLVIRDYTETRFIFDAEGSAHADVEWTTFGEEDDVALLNAFEKTIIAHQDPLRRQFGSWLEDNRIMLEQLGLVQFDRDRPGHAMVNTTKMMMLLVGAMRQMGQRVEALYG